MKYVFQVKKSIVFMKCIIQDIDYIAKYIRTGAFSTRRAHGCIPGGSFSHLPPEKT